MDLKISHTFVTVRDQDESLKFYRDVLGLTVKHDVTMDDFRWVSLTPPSQPDVEIVLEKAGMAYREDAEAIETLMAKGSLNGVIFRVGDVDATFEQIRAAGTEVLQEPINQAYGVRDCAFRDPSGNMLRFSQPL